MKYWKIKIQKGHSYAGHDEGSITEVTEPIALTLIKSGVAEAVGETHKLLSKPNTKSIDSGKITAKG